MIRRLHGLAALDPEVEQTLRAREERRQGVWGFSFGGWRSSKVGRDPRR